MSSVTSQPSYVEATSESARGLGCGCPMCGGMSAANGNGFASPMSAAMAGVHSGVRGAEMLAQVANGDGTYSYSGDRNIDAVLIGSRWTSQTLTFTFPTDGSYADPSYGLGIVPFNQAQQDAARAGFRMISSFTNLVITEVAPDQAEAATFRLASTVSTQVGSAQGSFPNFINGEAGDIWFGRTDQPYYDTPQKGNWGFSTMLHEIGHTMGMKHGQDDYSNLDLGSIFEGVGTLYGTRSLEYDKDGQAWSLMTYTGGPDGFNFFQGEGENQAQSFMQFDIAALQYLYGANFTTQAGDTVYRWDASTGEGFVNGVGQGRPSGNKVFETIWDGGGTDTYDLSNYDGDSIIDLRPGAFSTFSVAQRADNNAFVGGPLAAPGNVANALQYQGDVRSLIENAIGGAGNDRITGNQVANVLVGNGGDDRLAGGAGNDVLVGGAGNDIADFTGATSGITVTIDRDATDLKVANGVDVDTLSGIEGVTGTAFDDALTGDASANTLSGGAGGRDVLRGGAGDDVLIGGGYTLAFKDEADITRGTDATNRSLATAIALDGAFELALRETVSTAAIYPGETLPHATVVADAGGVEGVDYYRFTAVAGARALFDIDATNNYTGLEILDADGNVIATNYGTQSSDDGSRRGFDARLAYTFQSEGTFYIRVTGATFSGEKRDLQIDQPYTLHVSLEDAAVAAPVIRQTGSATLDGGSGDDRLVATAGDDRIDGGTGRDTLSYENHFRGVTVDLSVRVSQDTNAGRDTIAGVENLTGTRFADRLSGDAGANVIDGGGGSDTLDGGAGVDTLSFASQAVGVRFDLSAQGAAQAVRLGEAVTARNFENVTGSQAADTLTGDLRANIIDGGAGDDVLSPDARGGVGGGRDTLIGGEGRDTASFAAFDAPIVASLKDDASGYVTAAGVGLAHLRGMENLTGGSGADRLLGNREANVLSGGAGNDTLQGYGGDDTLEGGAGDDLISGGDGTDTAVFAGATDTTVDLRVRGVQQTGHGRDRLTSIENVTTGSGDDTVSGNDVDNVFVDGGGDDRYDGQGGYDRLSFAQASAGVVLDLSLADAQATAVGTKTVVGVEALTGSGFADYLSGDERDNGLDGGAGDDILAGGVGRDTLTGGAGRDVLVGDVIGSTEGGSDDRLSGGAGDDILLGGVGNDWLEGGDGDDFLSNGTFASTVFDGPNGPSFDRGGLIRKDGGDDTIDGGKGNDFAVLAYNGRQAGVTVDVRDPTARTSILSNGVAVGSIVGIERLGFEGGEGNDTVYGGAGYDIMATQGGDDVVYAGAGDDTVFAGSGRDVYDGGAGYDIISFADAKAGVTFDLMRTDAQDTVNAGIITASAFERVVASNFGDTISLTDASEELSDYGSGDDHFYGRGGSDKMFIMRTAEQASSIVLDGGDGDDDLSMLSFVAAQDITVFGGNGNDTIVLVGAARAIVDAGSGDDYVAVEIQGAAGEKSFSLTLGSGADRYFFVADETTVSVDRHDTIITDFAVADDQLDLADLLQTRFDADNNPYLLLSNYVAGDDPFRTGHYSLVQSGGSTLLQVDRDGFGGEAAAVTILTLEGVDATALTSDNFHVAPNDVASDLVGDPSWSFVVPTLGTTADDTIDGTDGRDRLIGLDGADTLFGLAGDDLLVGGAGDDVLHGGLGQDLLYGDAGADRFVFADAAEASGDAIRGFDTDDLVDLSQVFGGDARWIGEAEFGNVAGELRVTGGEGGMYTLSGDLDGDGIADFALSIESRHPLAMGDLVL